MLLACDGLYDVMTNSEACYFIQREFREGKYVEEAVKQIAEHAVKNLQSRDNVSVKQ